MVKETDHKPSALAKIQISFEYDKTWQEAKKAVRERIDHS
jgi:hypothetical protein